MCKGKKILIGVTGSIAAYKSATLIRLLVKSGAQIKVIMTDAACNFIPPLTLATISKNKVLKDIFEHDQWANHVELGRWADLFLIAPASCNTIAKIATGICDNLLQAVYLSSTCPVWVAPAMDEDMWLHGATKANIKKLESYGNIILPVGDGELASGLSGEGRMAEPEYIYHKIKDFFSSSNDLINKKVLITAGPTYEALDPIRFIGNHSTGKMGIALAKECSDRGANVTLITGPGVEFIPQTVENIKVTSASQMHDACLKDFSTADIIIMCAAVADYTPVNFSEEKIKKTEESFTLMLKKTDDILKKLGTIKTNDQLLIGFALETNNERENAVRKLKDKNADFIVLNSLNDSGAGFGHDTNKVSIIGKTGLCKSFELKSKDKVAIDIIDTILKKDHA